MANAFLLDKQLDPTGFHLADEEKHVPTASLLLPAGYYVVFAKLDVLASSGGNVRFRLVAAYPSYITYPRVEAEDSSTVGLFAGEHDDYGLHQTVPLFLAAHLPSPGAASIHGQAFGGASAQVFAVKIIALPVEGITTYSAYVSDWHPDVSQTVDRPPGP